jgi:hypothetical protein
LKAPKQLVIGLLGLILLVIGYSVIITVRASGFEKRLNRVEASYRDLQLRRFRFAVEIIRTQELPEAAARAKEEILRVGREVQAATGQDFRPDVTELNSPPRAATSK